MSSNVLRRITGRASAVLAVGAVLALTVANPALADTSQATAQAAKVTLAGGTVLDTGICSATNPGTGQSKSGPCTPASIVLPGQNLLTAGVLAQDALANNDGTSRACAGAVGSGGSIQIGTGPSCTVNPGTPDGVRLLGTTLPLLGGAGPALLSADAVYSECSASTHGAPTGTSTIADLRLGSGLLNLGGTGVGGTPIATNPGPNTTVTIAGLATLVLNEQTTSGGTLTVTALRLTVLPDANLLGLDLSALGLGSLLGGVLAPGVAGAEVIVGRVTCGPNAVAPVISAIPLAGLPFAAGTLAVLVGGAMVVRRHRSSTTSVAA